MISTHILDTSIGSPASNVVITLEKFHDENWTQLGAGSTNSDGRLKFDCPKEKGIYRLNFSIADYFKNQKVESFFMNTPVVFQITNTDRTYHVPLLLNPYGYTTYRGS